MPDSNTRLSLNGKDDHRVASWNFVLSLNAGDQLQLMWFSADNTIALPTIATPSSPTRPRIPSVILTVQQIR